MKILAFWNNIEGTSPVIGRPATVWLSDSCLLREGRPFYVPDFDKDIKLFPSAAIRIDKVGKGIQPRFADRYWTHISPWLNARACTLARQLIENGLPVDAAVAFDCSLISAPFFELTPAEAATFCFEIRVNDNAVCTWSCEQLRLTIQQAIAHISYNTTLKTGDIILLGFPGEGVAVSAGDELTICSPDNPNRIFNRFRIK